MSLEFHEEDVAPALARHRERLDPGQVELLPLGDRQGVGQTARAVLDLEHQRGLVFAGATGVVMADYREAGRVAGHVLDLLSEHVEAVVHARLPTGDRRSIGRSGSHLGGSARARHLHEPG